MKNSAEQIMKDETQGNNEIFCCEPFKNNLNKFDWYSFGETPDKKFVMPIIKETNWRVNHCFSCGKEVRGIEVPEEEMLKLLNK
jgi:hypothetical protein